MAGSTTDPGGITGGGDQLRAYRLFAEALDYEGELREQFLRRECGSDVACRAEIDALLMIATRDAPATGTLLTSPGRYAEDLAGHIYGHFRLTTRIGEGGMGVVYRAERTDGVQQSVAIKLISTTVGHAAQVRFEREAQLLAQIEHPAVARLVDAGVERGRAWIAMEFVNGLRIDDYCRAKNLSSRDIVGLLVQLAGAVAVAHRMLVVHNDIKPANVLVTAEGVPKLIDFGISRALQEAGAALPGGPATVGVGRLFSPGFAAPEQINGGPVTVATDVFGLGALAYRLLTGRSTFPDAVDPLDYMLAISQRDVESPSRTALKAGRPIEARQLRGDLDAILCKALERDPARRYVSALDMQEDLQNYLTRRPVKARPATIFYRFGKFARRNTLAVSLVGLLVVGAIVGVTFVELQRHRAEQARDMAARRAEFIENLLASVDPTSDKPTVTVAALLDSAAQELDHKLGGEPLVEASILGMIANTNVSLGRYPEALAASDRELAILHAHEGSALELARALSTRGQLFRELGKWSDALPPLRQAAALLRPLHAPADLGNVLNCLAAVLAHTEQEKAAEAMYHEAIAIESAGDAALRAQRMYPLYGLAILVGDMARYPEAAEYGRQALALARETLPADHPDLLNIETAYANTLAALHQNVAAELLFRQVIAAQTRVLGPEHKATLLTKLALVHDLSDQHLDGEAAAAALPVARSLEALLGADNAYAMSAWNLYGGAACSSHQENEGLAALRRVAAARQRIYSAGNWLVHSTQLGIGECLLHMNQYVESEATLLPAVAGLEAARGPNFNRTQDGYHDLHDLYSAMGKPDDAARWNAKLPH
jgi:tetratricopeptide (TPR) repeat protein/predicted Ser/Thr protein kinase